MPALSVVAIAFISATLLLQARFEDSRDLKSTLKRRIASKSYRRGGWKIDYGFLSGGHAL